MRRQNSDRRDLERRLAANLRCAREDLGWTQADLAADLAAFGWPGWTPATVAAIETGKRRVSLDELGALCTVLDVGLAYLVGAPASFPAEWPTPEDGEPGPGDVDAWQTALAISSRNRTPGRKLTAAQALEAEAQRRAFDVKDLEDLVAARVGITVDQLRDTLPHAFPGPDHAGLDVLAIRDDLAAVMRSQLAAKGRGVELSQVRGHATRGIQGLLAKHLGTETT
jgi:transcriptional regulator with XRE-family HTH domain